MVARWTQALVHELSWTSLARWAPGRLQLYVDDPALVAWGTLGQRSLSFSLVVLWWMVLGIPLSWTKGAVYAAQQIHRWIGVCARSVTSLRDCRRAAAGSPGRRGRAPGGGNTSPLWWGQPKPRPHTERPLTTEANAGGRSRKRTQPAQESVTNVQNHGKVHEEHAATSKEPG